MKTWGGVERHKRDNPRQIEPSGKKSAYIITESLMIYGC